LQFDDVRLKKKRGKGVVGGDHVIRKKRKPLGKTLKMTGRRKNPKDGETGETKPDALQRRRFVQKGGGMS